MTKISHEKPPVYERCHELFGVDWVKDRVVFAYGDTIHCAPSTTVPADVEAHEKTHFKQQAAHPGGAKGWWDQYLEDPAFRLSQEIEAYRAQYQWLERNMKNRNERFRIFMHMVGDLSGPIYGKLMTQQEAMKAIRS